ncbi:MAG: hypothetical protein MUC69_00175 [Gemmatimonadales bacterium]|jgi:hypothetical protein|nr:hypothetical protein [Gemmatimonadales bacterium]
MSTFRTLLVLVVATGLWACDGANTLAPATSANFVDSTQISALTGTPLGEPSAFSIVDRSTVRTDRSAAFDFAFDIDADGQPVLLPLVVLGIPSSSGVNSGLQHADDDFDDISVARQNGYITDSSVVVAAGDVLYARSRLACSGLGVPQYAKLEITDIDPDNRRIRFRYLANNNCGYRGLQPGVPEE